jgi:hypothetical protein
MSHGRARAATAAADDATRIIEPAAAAIPEHHRPLCRRRLRDVCSSTDLVVVM